MGNVFAGIVNTKKQILMAIVIIVLPKDAPPALPGQSENAFDV